MKSYWDLSARERLALTTEQLSLYATREAAIQGVLRPQEPVLIPEVESPGIAFPTPTHYFKVTGAKKNSSYSTYDFKAAFSTIDDAKAFVAMSPRYLDTLYKGSESYSITKSPYKYTIEMVEVHNAESIEEYYAINKEYNEVRTSNDAARAAYTNALTKFNNCAAKINRDHSALVAHKGKLENVIKNLDEFVAVCEGSFLMGCKCILKTVEPQLLYDALSEIPHSYEWLTVEIFGGVCLAEDNNPYRDISANSL